MALKDQAQQFCDPVHRANWMRSEIQRKSTEAREATAKAIRDREGTPDNGRGWVSLGIAPTAIQYPDGTIKYLTDAERERERRRIEKREKEINEGRAR